jgi:hypothetical protein
MGWPRLGRFKARGSALDPAGGWASDLHLLYSIMAVWGSYPSGSRAEPWPFILVNYVPHCSISVKGRALK